jgi:hypothetical protein
VPLTPAAVLDVDTPVGPARATVHRPVPADRAHARARGLLVLGHGAGGGIEAVDLVAVTAAVVASGWDVVLVEQPWRCAGRRVAAPPAQLDLAWTAVVTAITASPGPLGEPAPSWVAFGGRSAGARVACRTAAALEARAVVCLAFPLHPPGRPDRSRASELNGCPVPTLVVQGRRDPFGGPDEILAAIEPGRLPGGVHGADPEVGHVVVHAVDGDHGLKVTPRQSAAVVADWLNAAAG